MDMYLEGAIENEDEPARHGLIRCRVMRARGRTPPNCQLQAAEIRPRRVESDWRCSGRRARQASPFPPFTGFCGSDPSTPFFSAIRELVCSASCHVALVGTSRIRYRMR